MAAHLSVKSDWNHENMAFLQTFFDILRFGITPREIRHYTWVSLLIGWETLPRITKFEKPWNGCFLNWQFVQNRVSLINRYSYKRAKQEYPDILWWRHWSWRCQRSFGRCHHFAAQTSWHLCSTKQWYELFGFTFSSY